MANNFLFRSKYSSRTRYFETVDMDRSQYCVRIRVSAAFVESIFFRYLSIFRQCNLVGEHFWWIPPTRRKQLQNHSI